MARSDPKLELIRAVPLFASCATGNLRQIMSLTDEIDVPKDKVLMREGAIAHEFFIVIEGALRVERGGQLIAQVGPGEFVGEIGLVDRGPRTATVTANEPSRLLVLGHREFQSLLGTHPTIQLEILQALAKRVRRLEPDAVQ
jgi:CRP/FNR family transcriptional regulator, cyclic AMP receptor protein